MRTRVWQGGMTSLVVRGRNWIMGHMNVGNVGKYPRIGSGWVYERKMLENTQGFGVARV